MNIYYALGEAGSERPRWVSYEVGGCRVRAKYQYEENSSCELGLSPDEEVILLGVGIYENPIP
jgi:hypothetical protein